MAKVGGDIHLPKGLVAVIHGPNLNLLGSREPGVYGHTSLAEINRRLKQLGGELGLSVATFQSNHEGELIEHIHQLAGKASAIIINAGAYTHTSIAIRDALLAGGLPVIEVHMSNIYTRESFRHDSFIRDIAVGQISGFGGEGYELALRAAASLVKQGRGRAERRRRPGGARRPR